VASDSIVIGTPATFCGMHHLHQRPRIAFGRSGSAQRFRSRVRKRAGQGADAGDQSDQSEHGQKQNRIAPRTAVRRSDGMSFVAWPRLAFHE